MERGRGVIYFGAVGAGCAAILYALLKEFVLGLSHRSMPEVFTALGILGVMAFLAASGTAFLLWRVLRFDARSRGFLSGATIGVLSHIPFSALYVGSSVLFLGYGAEDFLHGFFGLLFVGWVFSLLPEALIGGIAGLLCYSRARRKRSS